MDLDYEQRRIQEAQDIPPLSDILLKVLDALGRIDNDLGTLRVYCHNHDNRLAGLDRELRAMREGTADIIDRLDTPDWRQRR